MRRPKAASIWHFWVSTYSNRKGEPRVEIVMSEGDARALAQGTDSALGALTEALATALFEVAPQRDRVRAIGEAAQTVDVR